MENGSVTIWMNLLGFNRDDEDRGAAGFLDKMDFKVIITTNGTLLAKNKEIILNSKSHYKTVISLHSFEANDNKLIILNDTSRYIPNFVVLLLVKERRKLWQRKNY